MCSQTAALTIDEELDYVSDSGSEVWNIMESKSIQNVLLMGVHTCASTPLPLGSELSFAIAFSRWR